MTVNGNASARQMRDRFLDWQCRLRQQAVRQDGGRPSPGMRSRVLVTDGTELTPGIVVLIVEAESARTTDLLRHIVRKSLDPRQRYEDGLRVLAAEHYQYPENFGDRLTALFSPGAALARDLLERGHCVLELEQDGRRYRLPCSVALLERNDPLYQATYWHNSIFNPTLSADSVVVAFRPTWSEVTTEAAEPES